MKMKEFLTIDFSYLDEQTRLDYLNYLHKTLNNLPKSEWYKEFVKTFVYKGSTFSSPFIIFFGQYIVANEAIDGEFDFPF